MTDRAGREAFLERYRATQPAVHAYLLRACAGERGRAEDLTQETFSAALVAWCDGRNEQVTLPWLLTVARNKLVDEYRKLDREAQRLPNAPWAREQSHRDDPAHVLECIRALPPMQRAVIALRFVDDLPVAEVARLLHKRAGAIDSLQRRALATLRTMLEENAQ